VEDAGGKTAARRFRRAIWFISGDMYSLAREDLELRITTLNCLLLKSPTRICDAAYDTEALEAVPDGRRALHPFDKVGLDLHAHISSFSQQICRTLIGYLFRFN
jgi:hypothetical protein